MDKKAGRPAVTEKRTTRTFKATDAEWQAIQEKAAVVGQSASEFIRSKTIGEDTVKEVTYGLYRIIGDRAAEAAESLDQEERNLDYLYDGIAPNRDGYEEAKIKIFARICEDFGVVIR
jgi:hypothetical protein